MNCRFHWLLTALVWLAPLVTYASETAAPAAGMPGGFAPELISQIAGHIIAAEIPREYEGSKDWGRTKRITTGLRSYGNFFRFDIHRDRNDVNDGIWKRYRLALVDPDKNLDVNIENLRTLEMGRIALTLNVTAKVHGWARIKIYESGVHIIALEAEGDTVIRLAIDADVGVKSIKSDAFLPGYAIDPVVTDARLKFKDFNLTRISNVGGTFAHEVGIALSEAAEDELKGQKLADKINRSINKHRDRLKLAPEMLLGKISVKTQTSANESRKATD